MFQNNPLLAQLKQQIKENLPQKEGTVKATEKGFGFLEVDSKTSFFIPPSYMKKVMHGDKVNAVIRTEKEREVAEPDQLIEPFLNRFIGRIKMIHNKPNVVPDHPQIKEAIRAKTIKGLNLADFKEGDWVVAYMTAHPLKQDKGFFCEIHEKIASSEDKIVPWWVTLAKHQLPNQAIQAEQDWQMLDEGLVREDLTALPFITIDSESTKDMDDALHTVANADGSFTLTIAIADPTAYVAKESPLDNFARERGFTIYLPGRNIPMLPRTLSDDLCSLHQDQARPALCCRVTIQADGVIANDATFFAATIKSQGRLAYDHVSDLLEHGGSETFAPNETIKAQIDALHQCAKARISWREQHAVTFPDKHDYRFELDEDSAVVAIHVESRRIANRMVEEAMITANICAGRVLRDHFGFGIFNVHSGFNKEKIADVLAILAENQAVETSEQALETIEGFSALRRWLNAQQTPYLDYRMRKLQAYSEIANQPAPHFAMGLDVYATWTSPIRKFGDMVNHRLLKAIITNQSAEMPAAEICEELAKHRKHHRMAERDVADWLYVQLLRSAVADKTPFRAEIFDINRAGMRVRLLDNGATVFIPAPLIVDNKERILCNNDNGTVVIDNQVEFKLGDEIEVMVVDIKETTRSIVAKPTKEFAVVAQNTAAE